MRRIRLSATSNSRLSPRLPPTAVLTRWFLGDLNNTPWGSAFRKMVEGTGLRDSGLGMGLQRSWPVGFWPLALPIDHFLVSERVRVLDRWMGPDVGFDHYPLVVDVHLEE